MPVRSTTTAVNFPEEFGVPSLGFRIIERAIAVSEPRPGGPTHTIWTEIHPAHEAPYHGGAVWQTYDPVIIDIDRPIDGETVEQCVGRELVRLQALIDTIAADLAVLAETGKASALNAQDRFLSTAVMFEAQFDGIREDLGLPLARTPDPADGQRLLDAIAEAVRADEDAIVDEIAPGVTVHTIRQVRFNGAVQWESAVIGDLGDKLVEQHEWTVCADDAAAVRAQHDVMVLTARERLAAYGTLVEF